MNKKIATAKNFVKRNERRVLYTALAVTTTVAVVQNSGIQRLNEFLKEHDLFDECYALTETD